jgi:hypothetical protein
VRSFREDELFLDNIRRYGNPSQLPSPMQDEYSQFAQHFATVFAPEILTIYLQQVELYVQNQTWLSKKCQYQIFHFFTEWYVVWDVHICSLYVISSSVKPKSTWAQLKPHFETLVSTFIFPQLTFNSMRQQLWENDPVDYVRMAVGSCIRSTLCHLSLIPSCGLYHVFR